MQQATRLPIGREGVARAGVSADPAATEAEAECSTGSEAGPAAGIADAKAGRPATDPEGTETLYACRMAPAPSQDQDPKRHPVAARPGGLAGAEGAFQSTQPAPAAAAATATAPADLALSAEQFHLPAYDAVLQRLIGSVVAQQSPVAGTDLARRIARMHGFQRTGSRIQDRVEQMALQVCSVTEGPGGRFYGPRAR